MQKTWQAQTAMATTTHSGGKDDDLEEEGGYVDNHNADDGQDDS